MLRNWSYLNKLQHKTRGSLSLLFCVFIIGTTSGQIGNYVFNGSFELKYNCNPPYDLNKAIGWCTIGKDSTLQGGGLHSINCFGNAPVTGAGFQYPHTGNSFARISLYCLNPCSYNLSRTYSKNRLKGNLVANKTYCVKMYVTRQNECPYAISNLSLFFGGNTTDTINYSNAPITYLIPQVKNPVTNLIIDTLNWIPITGTFVATGNEKYLVIGNFESNATTTNSLVDNSFGNGVWAEYFLDDVSCIEMDLPAYAGHDNSVVPGDSVFIGRQPDFALDTSCTWYKFPNMSTPIATISGLYVKPMVTTTYIVKQVLECSAEKWDTVVIYMNPVGLEKLKLLNEELKIFPVPANNFIELRITNKDLIKEFNSINIYNNLGQLLREEELNFKDNSLKIKTDELQNGVYSIQLISDNSVTVSKRFVITR